VKGSINIIKIDIISQISFHSTIINKKIINMGKINSARDSPNHVMLSALPLLLSKYLDIVVEAVCDIKPCPENLIKKIEKNNKLIDEILENR
jgi:hypothetical protein